MLSYLTLDNSPYIFTAMKTLAVVVGITFYLTAAATEAGSGELASGA